MWKLVQGISLNWHLALDTTVSHFFAIYLAQAGHFELAAAVSVGDSVLKLVLALPGSVVASRTRPSARVKCCLLLRPALAASWVIAILSLANDKSGILIAATFVAFKTIAITDNTLSADFQFFARQSFGLDLSQNSSIQNIIARAALAVSPAFALSFTYQKLTVLHFLPALVMFSCIGLSTLLSIGKVTSSFEKSGHLPRDKGHRTLNFRSIAGIGLMRWGLLYQLTVNFAFSGITYLMLVTLKPSSDFAINSLSALYLSFFTYQIVVMFVGDNAIPATKLNNIVYIVCGTAALSIAIGSSSIFWLNISLCSAMGLLYAFELVAVQKILISKLNGPGYLEYSALSKIFARIASAASVALLGFGVGMGIPPSSLLILCGLVGLCSAFLLRASNPERKAAMQRLSVRNGDSNASG